MSSITREFHQYRTSRRPPIVTYTRNLTVLSREIQVERHQDRGQCSIHQASIELIPSFERVACLTHLTPESSVIPSKMEADWRFFAIILESKGVNPSFYRPFWWEKSRTTKKISSLKGLTLINSEISSKNCGLRWIGTELMIDDWSMTFLGNYLIIGHENFIISCRFFSLISFFLFIYIVAQFYSWWLE